MKLTWMGHSCFLLESASHRLMLDPYREVPGLEDITGEVDGVLCSHDHFDHAHTQQLTITGKPSPFTIQKIDTFHDGEEGALRGKNIVHCLTVEGFRIVHLGDLGHLLSQEQLEPLLGCNVLLLPVGGTYTLDSAQAHRVLSQIQPRIAIPMHYRTATAGFPVLEPVENFLSLCSAQQICRYDVPTLNITADTPAQIAVLSI